MPVTNTSFFGRIQKIIAGRGPELESVLRGVFRGWGRGKGKTWRDTCYLRKTHGGGKVLTGNRLYVFQG